MYFFFSKIWDHWMHSTEWFLLRTMKEISTHGSMIAQRATRQVN